MTDNVCVKLSHIKFLQSAGFMGQKQSYVNA